MSDLGRAELCRVLQDLVASSEYMQQVMLRQGMLGSETIRTLEIASALGAARTLVQKISESPATAESDQTIEASSLREDARRFLDEADQLRRRLAISDNRVDSLSLDLEHARRRFSEICELARDGVEGMARCRLYILGLELDKKYQDKTRRMLTWLEDQLRGVTQGLVLTARDAFVSPPLTAAVAESSRDPAYQCPRCAARGKPGSGLSDPQCGFDPSGRFRAANWNCATLVELRHVADERGATCYSGDDTVRILPLANLSFPDDSRPDLTFLILGWYKSRGRHQLARVIRSDFSSEDLTLSEAEVVLAHSCPEKS